MTATATDAKFDDAFEEAVYVVERFDLSANAPRVAKVVEFVRARIDEKIDANASRAFWATKDKLPGVSHTIIDAVVKNAWGIDPGTPPLWKVSRAASEAAAGEKKLVVIRAHRVKPRKREPLWPGFVYFGSATLIYGMPGIGKSTVVNDVIARLTVGAAMPGEPEETRHPPRSVVILTAEDDPEEVIAPQLRAAGAEMVHVFIVPSAKIGGKPAPIDLVTDLAQIETLIEKNGLVEEGTDCPPLGLVVLSPITAYLGRADANSVTAVRGALDPFFDTLRRRRVACVNIGHPRKDAGDAIAMYQNLGSVAWAAAHRVLVMAMKNPDSDGSSLLLRSKTNVDKDVPFGFGYRIDGAIADFGGGLSIDTTKVAWEGRDDRDPTAVMTRMKEIRSESKADRAARLIEAELSKGPRKQRDMKAMSEEAGIGVATFNDAKRRLGVESSKRDPSGKTGAEVWWRLPVDDGDAGPGEQSGMPF